MLVNMNISEFLEETASSSPAPGGGSVAALAGSLAAALSTMVANLSIGKNTEEDQKIWLEEQATLGQSLMQNLKEGIDKDTDAFNKVMAAFKMPKATDEDKKERSAAIQEGMKGAADLPYETAKTSLAVMELSLKMLEVGNPNAASDAAVAGLMAYAGFKGAIYNVKINLSSIKDMAYVDDMKTKIEEMQLKIEESFTRLKVLSDEKIG